MGIRARQETGLKAAADSAVPERLRRAIEAGRLRQWQAPQETPSASKAPWAEGPARVIVDKGSITVGSVRIDTINAVGDRHRWSLALTAGQVVNISQEAYPLASNALEDPFLRLYDPQGNLLGSSDDRALASVYAGSFNSLIAGFTAAASGTYIVETGAFSDAYNGEYVLRVYGSQLADLRFDGAAVPSSVNRGDFLPFQVSGSNIGSAAASEHYWLAVLRAAGREYLVGGCYYGGLAAGGTVNCAGMLQLPPNVTGGASLFLVADRDWLDELGPNWFYWDNVPEVGETSSPYNNDVRIDYSIPSTAFPTIASGQALSGTLPTGTRQWFEFAGIANQQVAITLSSSAFDAYLRLYGPDGVLIAFNDDYNGLDSRIDAVLPADGPYYINVGSYFDGGGGDYVLALNSTTGAADLAVESVTFAPTTVPSAGQLTVSTTVRAWDADYFAQDSGVAEVWLCGSTDCYYQFGTMIPTIGANQAASFGLAGPAFAPPGQYNVYVWLLVPNDGNAGNNLLAADGLLTVTDLPVASYWAGINTGAGIEPWPLVRRPDNRLVTGTFNDVQGFQGQIFDLDPFSQYRPDVTLGPITGVAIAGQDLLVATFGGFDGGASVVQRIPPSGAPTPLLVAPPDPNAAYAVAVIGTDAYAADYRGPILRVPVGGGTPTTIADLGGGCPSNISATSLNTLLVPLWCSGAVMQVAVSGQVTELVAPGTFAGPVGVVRARSGNIYVGDQNGLIHRVSPGGVVTLVGRIPDGRAYGLALRSDSALYITSVFPFDVANSGWIYRLPVGDLPEQGTGGVNVAAYFTPDSIGTAAGLPLPQSLDLHVDLTGAGDRRLGSYAGTVRWDSLRVRLDSVRSGDFGGVVANQPNAGQLNLSGANAQGVGGDVRIARLWFRTLGTATDTFTTTVTPAFAEVTAAVTFEDLLPYLTVRSARIRSGVLRGDVNGDGIVGAVDAQAVLAYVVGLPLPPGWTPVPHGDANCDGLASALDAQIILSYVVGIPVPQFCVGTRR